MPKRQKSETCSKGWCKNHVFELTPLTNKSYFKKPQRSRLCPKHNKYEYTDLETPIVFKNALLW